MHCPPYGPKCIVESLCKLGVTPKVCGASQDWVVAFTFDFAVRLSILEGQFCKPLTRNVLNYLSIDKVVGAYLSDLFTCRTVPGVNPHHPPEPILHNRPVEEYQENLLMPLKPFFAEGQVRSDILVCSG